MLGEDIDADCVNSDAAVYVQVLRSDGPANEVYQDGTQGERALKLQRKLASPGSQSSSQS